MKSPRSKRMIKAIVSVLGVASLLLIARLSYVEEQGNFHPITPGEAYRSAQLDQDELECYVTKYAIRSVINLRGTHHDEKWYKDEMELCGRLGVVHYDLALSPDKAPAPMELRSLLSLFETAPRPVLIHCHAGADRSGLAAALWKMVVDKAPKSAARKQLSIFYGHMPFGPTQALDDFIEKADYSLEKRRENSPGG